MKILMTFLVLFIVVCSLQAVPNLKAIHQTLTTYYGDRADLQNAEHVYVTQDNQLYSVFYNQKTMSFYTEMPNGQKFYVVAEFEKNSEEQVTIAYRYHINSDQRSTALNFKVEYLNTSTSRSYKILPTDENRGWGKPCWECLLNCLGTGTSCGLCIASPSCWGTWGAGCLLCIPSCASALSKCLQCGVCF